MTIKQAEYTRGAQWRRWDLHIHTPASKLGNPFVGVTWENYVNQLAVAAEKHEIAVIGITDYMSIDGYEKLYEIQKNPNNSWLSSTLLIPNIEFRCSPQTKGGSALNIHLLVDVTEKEDVERIKKSLRNLRIKHKDQSYGCIRDDLIAFAKAQDPTLVDDEAAYKFGIEQFKPSYMDLLNWFDGDGWLKEHSVIGVANIVEGGISGLPLDGFAATRDELLSRSHFVFSGNPADRLHYLGLKEGYPAAEIKRQYKTLKPCFHGSDAHSVEKLFEPDKQRYCWIKADPTFYGLLQAIKEPADRVFIGTLPEKLREVSENKTFFIDSVEVKKNKDSSISEDWLAGCRVLLNHDLVAIIGNKGSGKSALADIIALLGNSKQKEHFAFLKKGRFRGKSGDPAKQFNAEITWFNGTQQEVNLTADPEVGRAELIRYIPQGYFEDLCNEHVSGKSDPFQKELETVIFEHAGDEIRLGALNFEQLVDDQEGRFRDQLAEYRKELSLINRDIENLETQSQPHIRQSLLEYIELKNKQIEEHNATEPSSISKPSEQLSPEQLDAATKLEEITVKLKELDEKASQYSSDISNIAAKRKAVQSIRDHVRLLERQYSQFQSETAQDFQVLGLSQSDLVSLILKLEPTNTAEAEWMREEQELTVLRTKMKDYRDDLVEQQAVLTTKLNEPQLIYQQNLKSIEQWTEKLQELIGTADAPETLRGLELRIVQLNEIPAHLKIRKEQRLQLAGEIFDSLNAQREAREKLFKPVQDLIENNNLIRSDYKLRFQANLNGSSEVLATKLFQLVKQNVGEFRGEDESFALVKRLSDEHTFVNKDGALRFIQELDEKIYAAAATNSSDAIGINSMLRKGSAASDVYDLLFGLSYLEPRYSLLFQGAEIAQLSPGQRGALLLIFYLLVDKGRRPIVLDQPEENLDNETIYNLLVRYLQRQRRSGRSSW